MLISSLLAITALTGLISTSSAAPSKRYFQDSNCEPAFHVGSLIVDGPPPVNNQRASFQGAEDSQRRLELTTEYEGAYSPDYPQFAFVPCTSTNMPNGPVKNSDGSVTRFGLLHPNAHPNKCVSAEALLQDNPTPLVSSSCPNADGELYFQYWSLTTYTSKAGNTLNHTLGFVGSTLNIHKTSSGERSTLLNTNSAGTREKPDAQAQNLVREWVEMPADFLTPSTLDASKQVKDARYAFDYAYRVRRGLKFDAQAVRYKDKHLGAWTLPTERDPAEPSTSPSA
ncbi:hypothetical protein CF327_g237 [Tilletia walkeri]|nr:hypothetical protein CF327_g237 [Tilletia walkeri]